ncbi:unnamed protein product [Camellia sinensis]
MTLCANTVIWNYDQGYHSSLYAETPSMGVELERKEEKVTAGEVFCGRASIPEPIVVPIIKATAPGIVPFFSDKLVAVGTSIIGAASK